MSGLAFSLGSRLVRLAPPGLRYGSAAALGSASYALRPGIRRQAIANYAAILDLPESDRRVARVAHAAVVGYTKLIADFLLIPQLSREGLLAMVELNGMESLHAALSGGTGAIVVTPHFGNWDMAAAAAAASGIPVTVVTERFGADAMNRKVIAARERLGLTVVPLGIAAGKASLSALRRGEVIGLVCDLPKEGRNVEVSLVGQRAMVPAGPALLSLRSGAPVVPITCVRLADGRYRLDVQASLTWVKSGDAERDVNGFAQAIVDRFEPVLRRHPEQWYLFSPMWNLGPAAPHAEEPAATLHQAVSR